MANSKHLMNNTLQHEDKYNGGAVDGENVLSKGIELLMSYLKSNYEYKFSISSSISQ